MKLSSDVVSRSLIFLLLWEEMNNSHITLGSDVITVPSDLEIRKVPLRPRVKTLFGSHFHANSFKEFEENTN